MTSSTPTSKLAASFALSGTLRASINTGNPILASLDAASGKAVGVSIDLAREFGARLGLPVDLVVFDKAAKSVDAVKNGQADIGFFAIDPARSDGLFFSAAYVLIEGSYMVPASAALTDNAEVDRPGTRIGVGSGSAYDLFLTRELKDAHIERLLNAQEVVDALQAGRIDVAAGIRKQLATLAQTDDSLRLLPGRFMVIQQAMGMPAGRGAGAEAFLSAFVEEMKSSGFVADAMARHGIDGASVAP